MSNPIKTGGKIIGKVAEYWNLPNSNEDEAKERRVRSEEKLNRPKEEYQAWEKVHTGLTDLCSIENAKQGNSLLKIVNNSLGKCNDSRAEDVSDVLEQYQRDWPYKSDGETIDNSQLKKDLKQPIKIAYKAMVNYEQKLSEEEKKAVGKGKERFWKGVRYTRNGAAIGAGLAAAYKIIFK